MNDKRKYFGFFTLQITLIALQIGYVLPQDNQYFFGQTGQGRFVPSSSFHNRNGFFSPSSSSFNSLKHSSSSSGTGSESFQNLFLESDAVTQKDTSTTSFGHFTPFQSTRSPDYYELSPRPFGPPASTFIRPNAIRPSGLGGSSTGGFNPLLHKTGRANVPHQQGQFLAHFNEQTHPSGLHNQQQQQAQEKSTTQSPRITRPHVGSGFSRNRPVGGTLNRQNQDDLYSSQQQHHQQQQLPYRNSRNRFQPNADRSTTSTTTTTTTEKPLRYNRFGSGRSLQAPPSSSASDRAALAKLQTSSSSTSFTPARPKPNKTLFQPRRPVFISREVNEPVHLKNKILPSKITINHNGSNNNGPNHGNNNNSNEDDILDEEINEANHVQDDKKQSTKGNNDSDIDIIDDEKEIPLESFEKLRLHEAIKTTQKPAGPTAPESPDHTVILTSNFFLPGSDQSQSQEDSDNSESQQSSSVEEDQMQKALAAAAAAAAAVEGEAVAAAASAASASAPSDDLTTHNPADYEYEYEDYDDKSTTLPSAEDSVKEEEITVVEEPKIPGKPETTEDDSPTNLPKETHQIAVDSSESPPDSTTINQQQSDESSTEYDDDELDDEEGDEESDEGDEEELSEESPEHKDDSKKNNEDIVGQAIVQVITTKSVINGSTAYPQQVTPSINEEKSETSEEKSVQNKSADSVKEIPEIKEDTKEITPSSSSPSSPVSSIQKDDEDADVNNATEGYVVVASIQTSRSISGARFLPFPVVEQEERKQTLSELERKIHEQKRKKTQQTNEQDQDQTNDSISPKDQEITTEEAIITMASTSSVAPETTTPTTVTEKSPATNISVSTESIIDKLDRVQSELSSGLLTGKFPILNAMREIELSSASTTTTTTTTTAAPPPKFVPNIRKFMPKTTTPKPEKKIDIDAIPMDDITSLLPPGFKPRITSFRNRKITTTTTTTETPKSRLDALAHKPQRNFTIGRSFKNTPVAVQDVAITGLLPKGYNLNNTASRTTTSAGSTTESSVTPKILKDLLSKIKFEDNLDKLLPKDYKEKAVKTTTTMTKKPDNISALLPPGYKHPASTAKTTQKPLSDIPVKEDINKFLPPGYKPTNSTIESTTTKKPSIGVVPLSDDLSKFLPPGFKPDPVQKDDDSIAIDISKLLPKDFKPKEDDKNTESILKKVEFKDVSSLLPPGFKENTTKEEGSPAPAEKSDAGLKVIFPKSLNKRPGSGRLTTSKPPGGEGPQQQQIVIKKGPPTRATTEFTGWPTPSTTPISIEKLLEQSRTASIDLADLLPQSSTTTTTTTTTTTPEPPKPTEPGLCRSECDLAGTIKIIDGVKWKPELLDHNTDEWKSLAREVEAQLNEVYSKAPRLNKWYKKVRIDSFNKGSVLVDYFVELSNISREVDTLEIKHLFHEALTAVPLTVLPLSENNETIEYNEPAEGKGEKLVKETYLLGRFVVDPVSTDFIVIPKSAAPTIEFAEEDVLIPQWAIVVIVIGVGSLCFVVVFGVTVLLNRQKAKKSPTPLTNDMLHELNKNHMGGVDNYGVDDFYNIEDTWNDTKQPIKPKRFTNSMHGSSASNIYDSWRSQRGGGGGGGGGDYYYDNHNYTPHNNKIDPYPPDAFSDAHQMYTYNPRSRYYKDYDPEF